VGEDAKGEALKIQKDGPGGKELATGKMILRKFVYRKGRCSSVDTKESSPENGFNEARMDGVAKKTRE